ncbi:MAG: HEAT repeat domain-containing protein [Gemmataceae bacterium]
MLSRRFIAVSLAVIACLMQRAQGTSAQTIQIEEKPRGSIQAKRADKAPPSPQGDDADTLREAGLNPTDINGLLQFFRARTLAEVDRTKIAALVEKLASDQFSVRDEARQELEKIGAPAVPLLRQRLSKSDDDPEVHYLCDKSLRRIEKVAGPAVSSAAARVIARTKPPHAAETLIAYLPFADDGHVAEEVGKALEAVAFVNGQPDPALVRALQNELPLKRAVAAETLIHAGSDSRRQEMRKMLHDKDAKVRLRVAAALFAYHDLQTVPVLIDLLGENMPLADAKQAENLLIDLGGEISPKISVQADEASRKKSQLAWEEWWKTYDGPGLLATLRKQTPSDTQREEIVALIRQLNEEGETRQKAIEQLTAFGPVAYSLVRQAARPEEKTKNVAALVFKNLEKKESLPNVVDLARLLRVRRPSGAIEALLAYLPAAEEEAVDEVCSTLASLGVADGKPDGALVRALSDKVGARRAGAAVALVRARVKDSMPAIQKLLQDPEPSVRLQVASALIPQGQKEAVPVLIELIAQLPVNKGWEAENLLYRLAEDKPPTTMLSDDASRKKCHDAWAGWWKANAAKVDLGKLDVDSHFLGYTLVVSTSLRGRGDGQVVELGRDGKPRWQIEGLIYPMDAHVVGNNRVLVTEYSANQVTERTFKGEILWKKDVPMPLACQRLPNGNTFVACQNQILELDRTGKEVVSIPRPSHDVMSAQKLRNGQIVLLTNNGSLTRLDATGKETSSVPLHAMQILGGSIDVLPNGHVLVPQYRTNKIVEYDAEGKVAWEAAVSRPVSAYRLPNGHTLVGTMNPGQVLDLDHTGKTISEKKIEGRLMKARRR